MWENSLRPAASLVGCRAFGGAGLAAPALTLMTREEYWRLTWNSVDR